MRHYKYDLTRLKKKLPDNSERAALEAKAREIHRWFRGRIESGEQEGPVPTLERCRKIAAFIRAEKEEEAETGR